MSGFGGNPRVEERGRPRSRAYVVGASKERLPAICERLRRDGFEVCGHCDRPREFSPPRDATLMLLITDMGSHATLRKARDYCRVNGVPCVGGLWRSWSTTRDRLAAFSVSPPHAECANCSAQGCCGRRVEASASREGRPRPGDR